TFYADYFERLAAEHPNFNFHLALSDPLDEDRWSGPTGFIHEVVLLNYLQNHPKVSALEFYLCGPPMMIKACGKMLKELGVRDEQIAYDEF
ncbi:MAG: NADH:ubiquinone reductase (Na(+)-transporting) subunit F, partial [Verrucomicrobiota bacterium]